MLRSQIDHLVITAPSLAIGVEYVVFRRYFAADLDAELAGVEAPPLELELRGAGCFGAGSEIHAIWAGVALRRWMLRPRALA